MPCIDFPVTIPDQNGDIFCDKFIENFETLEKLAEQACDPFQYLNYADWQSGAVTTIVTAGVWEKLNTTTQVIHSVGAELAHTNNRITNIATDGWVRVNGIASLSAGNSTEIHVAIFKNGAIWPCSEQSAVTIFKGGQNKASAIPFQCTVQLDAGDFVEVYVKNEDTTDNITLLNVNLIAEKLKG